MAKSWNEKLAKNYLSKIKVVEKKFHSGGRLTPEAGPPENGASGECKVRVPDGHNSSLLAE